MKEKITKKDREIDRKNGKKAKGKDRKADHLGVKNLVEEIGLHIKEPKRKEKEHKKDKKEDKGVRHITETDREIWRHNAEEGTKKWEKESAKVRLKQRNRSEHGWGFDGNSPDTRPRVYKTKTKKLVKV